jgi:hypothetical protein
MPDTGPSANFDPLHQLPGDGFADLESASRPIPRPAHVEQFAATVRTSPCYSGGGSDYTDARYFLDRAVAQAGLEASDEFAGQAEQTPGIRQCFTATNLAELAAGTHLVPAGTLVQVLGIPSRERGGAKHYVFSHTPPISLIVTITGAASGGGKYTGSIVGGTSTATSAGNLAMPEGMQVGAAVLILNPAEDGLSTHTLRAGTFHNATLVGPGVAQIDCVPTGNTASPTTLGGTSEGSESADTSHWTRSTDGSPLDLYVVTRMVYNESGDQTLYQFVRKLSFDACGLLTAVSSEARVTIDATEPC